MRNAFDPALYTPGCEERRPRFSIHLFGFFCSTSDAQVWFAAFSRFIAQHNLTKHDTYLQLYTARTPGKDALIRQSGLHDDREIPEIECAIPFLLDTQPVIRMSQKVFPGFAARSAIRRRFDVPRWELLTNRNSELLAGAEIGEKPECKPLLSPPVRAFDCAPEPRGSPNVCLRSLERRCLSGHWTICGKPVSRWSLQESLPLHLCPLTGYLAVLMLLTRNYYLYEFVYFMGIAAPGLSLLTPDIDRYGFPHYKFFLFFISHSLPVTAALYMTIVEGCQPSLGSIGRIAVEINVLMLSVWILNAVLGSNYIFLNRKPRTTSLYDLLGPWPWYILGLELVGCITSLLLWLPFCCD